MVIRTLYDTPEMNQEALAYINIAKSLDVEPLIIVYKEEGLTLLRLNRKNEAITAFQNYLHELENLEEQPEIVTREISWSIKMLHKVKAML